jgi:glucosamine--fructose-6-phosphate aminotransferase (isomerizing)
MCGIVGFVGDEPAAPVVLRAISRLDYRGYDSAGMVSIDSGRVYLQKDVGGINEVNDKHRLDQMPGKLALGHVRWATHGRANRANAHPHLDCKGQIAIVHNGIIYNHRELRARLAGRHTFVSEADTEVICHLIEDCIAQGNSLEEAVFSLTRQLRGSYAVAVVSCLEPGKIVAVAEESPLVVGLNGNKQFVASDALSFLDQTDEVIFLEGGEVVSLTSAGANFFNRRGERITKQAQRVDWPWQEATKDGYDSFTVKEILEEPRVIAEALKQDRELIRELAGEISQRRQVLLTGCGSSRHAALLGSYLLSGIGGRLCHVVTASELPCFADAIMEDALLIAVSQSGETADVIDGVRKARGKGARVTRISDRVIYINCGPEIGVAATKSFVGQAVIFYLLAFALAGRLEAGIKELAEVSEQIQGYYDRDNLKLQELARRVKDESNFFYVARGANMAVAAEGALKLKEIAYAHTECMPAGELKHGTLALMDAGTPVIAICPDDRHFQENASSIMEMRARDSYIIGVSDENSDLYDQWLELPKVLEPFYPLAAVMPLHLLAYHVAIARGRDPDRPRHLAKSVTVR